MSTRREMNWNDNLYIFMGVEVQTNVYNLYKEGRTELLH